MGSLHLTLFSGFPTPRGLTRPSGLNPESGSLRLQALSLSPDILVLSRYTLYLKGASDPACYRFLRICLSLAKAIDLVHPS